MRTRWNGSIQSGNTPTHDKNREDDPYVYRCMITKVIYVDDADNFTKNSQNPEVLYDCVVIGGFQAGSPISGCRLSNQLGGSFNYESKGLRAATKDISKTKLSENDGDIVYVQFVQGHSGYPVIMGLGTGIKDASSGTSRAQGPRSLKAFNGWVEEISNKGEFSIKQYIGSTTDGIFTALDTINYKFEALKDEVVKETFKSGMVVTKDGKNDSMTITTAGGAVVLIDGKNNKCSIKAGSTEVLIDSSTGKISLKGSMVDLGSSVSDMVTQFTALATAFATHMHPYTDDGNPSITGPPTAPLMTDVGSQSVKVQG